MISLPVIQQNAQAAAGSPPPAPDEARKRHDLIDAHGRRITDLRLSLTDRCNFRCVYCLDPDVQFLPRAELLTADELVRLAHICSDLGVRKIRLTGGEPALHPQLTRIIEGIRTGTNADIALTTNGSLLDSASLHAWRTAGLDRITVSIDSLDEDRFARITRSRTTPGRVLEGLAHAVDNGYPPPKVNAVVVRGFNDDEVADLADLARTHALVVRFIEYMPLDAGRAWERNKLVPATEILDAIRRRHDLVPLGRHESSSTATRYAFSDGAPGEIGLIASVTAPFCGQCSRLRITADGKVRPCLFSHDEWDLRPLLRADAPDRDIARFLADATWTKQAGHGISLPGFKQPDRTMSAIGG